MKYHSTVRNWFLCFSTMMLLFLASCDQATPTTFPSKSSALNSPLNTPISSTTSPLYAGTMALSTAMPLASSFSLMLPKAKIVFQSEKTGSSQIYIRELNGDTKQLTSAGSNTEPKWSHDGTHIAYTSSTGQDRFDIYIMNSDGSNQHQLLKAPHRYTWAADWSTDDKQILFSSNLSGQAKLYITDINGNNPQLIDVGDGNSFLGAFSPDGKRIAFTSDRGDGSNAIYVVDRDGKNLMILTDKAGAQDASPVWSPDGLFIAFQSLRDGNSEIYVVGSDGTHLHRITTTVDINEVYPRYIDNSLILVSTIAGINKDLAILNINDSTSYYAFMEPSLKAFYGDITTR